MGIKSNKSFALVEMIIVVGVLGFALPVLFAIMFIIIQQQGRIYSLQTVKKEGDFAYNSIKSTIRQYGKLVTAHPSIYPSNLYPTIYPTTYPTDDPCPIMPNATPTPASFIYLYDKSMTAFSYEFKNDSIASNSAENNITDSYLTSSNVLISNVRFTCYRTSQFSPPVVGLYFTVTKSGAGANPPTMNYASRFQLKSY